MRISVGLPFFNARTTLAPAIASVLNQSMTDFELILLDDGSTDDSRAVAQKALADPRVRLISDGVNRGLAARLNQLAILGQCRLLARMDADDVMHPDRLFLQRDFLLRSRADVVGSGAYIMDERMHVNRLRHPNRLRTRSDVLLNGGLIHPSCLGWTEWFRQNPYDEAYPRAEDLELWTRTVERSRFEALDTPLLFYRESRKPNLRAYRAAWRSARKVFRRYGRGALAAHLVAQKIVRTYAADLLYLMASYVPGATEALLDLRSSPISDDRRGEAEAILARAIRAAAFSLP
jgi:glycosyltransferase involved in cell wall biosynthesis